MTVSQLLRQARELLPSGPYDNPTLDSILLLAHCMGKSKEQVYAALSDPVPRDVAEAYLHVVQRRSEGEPLAYILGKKEFYGLEFSVDPRVLIPRPDTEILVEWVLQENPGGQLRLHDCCTGSGAVAIACAANRMSWQVSASDISPEAGEVFAENWKNLIAPGIAQGITPWRQSDLLSALEPGEGDIITANPPYLESGECDEKAMEGWREPRMALDGGADGLDLIRKLIAQAAGILQKGGQIFIEAAHWQADSICKELRNNGFGNTGIRRDLGGLNRVSRGVKL